jgi:hypothetical protein
MSRHFASIIAKGLNGGQRFDIAVRQIVGKRLTWDQLTGKVEQKQPTAEPF